MAFFYDERPGEDECPDCGRKLAPGAECTIECYEARDRSSAIYNDFDDDDHGPLDSPEGDSESDHVWADLARSEAG